MNKITFCKKCKYYRIYYNSSSSSTISYNNKFLNTLKLIPTYICIQKRPFSYPKNKNNTCINFKHNFWSLVLPQIWHKFKIILNNK